MHNPLTPRRPPPATYEPPVQQPLGIDAEGRFIYPYPPSAPPQPQASLVAHPWGAYIAGGCLAVVALTVLAVIGMALLFGFAILASVLALVAVALTICVLVLRSMWREERRRR